MSADPRYAWTGWHDGATDCEPPEPGKEWLTITQYGEEYAVVVLGTAAFAEAPDALDDFRRDLEERADWICACLDASPSGYPAMLRLCLQKGDHDRHN